MNILTDRQNMVVDESPDENSGNDEDETSFADRCTLPLVPEQNEPPSVSLTYLIDLAVQETYRLWTITVEYMERRNDMDRKICMVDFTRTTRTLYLKLYAVVKWARIAKALDQKTTGINFVLDQLSQHYVEMADSLARLASEELIFARLPIFEVSTAVDVLSLGTMPKFPAIIKKKHIPEEPLTQEEQAMTLKHLEQMLEYRLLQESQFLPVGFTKIKIENGMCIFTVPDEFQMHMTLTRAYDDQHPANFDYDVELKNWQWTLLDLKILVVDYEMGLGRPLVHTRHKQLLIDICRSSMRHSHYDVHIVYEILHDFCQKLQLDLLFCQAQSLCQSISTNHVSIEAYDLREGFLSIVYWLSSRRSTEYRIIITRDQKRVCGKLKLLHQPSAFNLPQLEFINGQPQFHSLFTKTMLFRCRKRLNAVKRVFRKFELSSPAIRLIGDASIRLTYRIIPLDDAERDESLYFAVNIYSGRVLCSIPALEEGQSGCIIDEDECWMEFPSKLRCSKLEELEEEINSNCNIENKNIEILLTRLHLCLILRRFAQTGTNLHFRPISHPRSCLWIDKWKKPNEERMYLQFNWDLRYFLILCVKMEDEANFQPRFFIADSDGQKMKLHELNIATLVRDTPISNLESKGIDIRKWPFSDANLLTATRRQIRVALSTIADRLLFVRLTENLQRRGIKFSPVESEKEVGGYVLKITDFTDMLRQEPSIPSESDLFRNFVSCSLRLQVHRNQITWPFECVLKNVLLVSDVGKTEDELENLKRQFFSHVQDVNYVFHYGFLPTGTIGIVDSVQQNLVDRIKIYANMFDLAQRFAFAYDYYFKDLCSVLAFSYHKLTILYGRRRDLILIISYKVSYNGFWVNFAQSIGPNDKRPYNNKWNAHSVVALALSQQLNSRRFSNGHSSSSDLDQTYGSEIQRESSDHKTEFGVDREDPILSVVNYIVNTDRTLNLIFHFSYVQLRSLESHSLIHGLTNELVNLELKSYLIPITEHHIRVKFGVAHLDFWLLDGNQAAIEAIRWKDAERRHYVDEFASFPFFLAFWSKMAGRPLENLADKKSQLLGDFVNVESGTGPASVPAPIHNENEFPQRSCPSLFDFWNETEHLMEINGQKLADDETEDDRRPLIDLPLVVIDADTMERAMEREDGSLQPSPFEQYLNGVMFVTRMGHGLRAFQRSSQHHLPITNLSTSEHTISFDLVGFEFVNTNTPVWRIRMHIYVCSHTFVLKSSSSDRSLPSSSDVHVFERYFEEAVAPLCNEFALLSFLIMCRICATSVFPAFACLMRAHLDSMLSKRERRSSWLVNAPKRQWIMHLQLLDTTNNQPKNGIAMTPENAIWMTIHLKSIRKHPTLGRVSRKINLIYNVEMNKVTARLDGPMEVQMPTIQTVQWLSWNNARLMALLLNSLTGLLTYFDSNVDDLTLDTLFALRIQQSQLQLLNERFSSNGIHREVFSVIGNLSRRTDRLVERGLDRWKETNSADVLFLLEPKRQLPLQPYQRLDERWRWQSKSGVEFGTKNIEWLNKNGRLFECLLELRVCSQLSSGCQLRFTIDSNASQRPLAPVAEQLVYLASVNAFNCTNELDKFIDYQTAGHSTPRSTNELAASLCTNFIDETAKIRKDRRRLTRADSATVQLLAEQVVTCGRLGFVEFVDPHVLETLFAWQQPKSGCYARTKPEPVPRHGVVDAMGLDDSPVVTSKPKEEQSGRDECNQRFSSLVLNALVVALRLFVDPPQWPELRLHDQELLVQMHQIAAEDQFATFRYVDWVKDAQLPSDLRLRPPPHAWSPDLIAFVILAFIFVAGSVVAHYVFTQQQRPGIGPRPHNAKQFYMYGRTPTRSCDLIGASTILKLFVFQIF
ncbi:Mediator complex subunit rgr-1 [Aphelenchoides besseyi]|nr:Mediator complex subunit rgr-1 [Aphelenchoides besseyi]